MRGFVESDRRRPRWCEEKPRWCPFRFRLVRPAAAGMTDRIVSETGFEYLTHSSFLQHANTCLLMVFFESEIVEVIRVGATPLRSMESRCNRSRSD